MANRTDNFNRADTGGGGLSTPSDGGSSWTDTGGNYGIDTNRCANKSGSAGVVCVLESSLADVEVQYTNTFSSTARVVGLVARYTDDNNYLLFHIDFANSVLRFFKKDAGSFTQIGSDVALSGASGDVWKFKLNGTAIDGYQNGSLKTSSTSSFNQTATKHGIRSQDTDTFFDDFSITAVAAGATRHNLLLLGCGA